jgi:hypothetical protein
MIKILNEHYYLDLDAIEEYINVDTSSSLSADSENTISVVRYELVKTLTEILLTEREGVDESLGPKSSELSIPFKFAFNSLINKKLIQKY